MGASPEWWMAVGLVALPLLGETWLSRRHERRLRAAGAVEPPGDVYAWLRVAYVGGFLAMAAEGWARGTAVGPVRLVGLVLFGLAKALKYAAIAALGERWSFRVLVLPGRPLVASGPYRCLDHPNYVAVAGEVAGAACLFGAPVAGVLATAGVVVLLRRRIAIENAALGRTPRVPG
jgi:methyltransferase